MPGYGAGRGAKVPGGAPGAMRAADTVTLGVEEEFVLLDPATGAAVPAGPELVRMLGGEPGVRQELMRFQVETATGVCTSLDQVGRELARLRRLAAAAAAQLGCRLVACGAAPYRTPGLAAVTGQPRYRELARRYGPVVAEAGTCGCHVHVGVPSRDLGVQVLARLRPWLAPLLAITANSPIVGGHDTGWASWRYVLQSRWPTAVPPEAWPDAAAYDAAVRRLIGRGAALDERNVYFWARLSPRYPTVEVRVADVCLDAGTAVLLAGLTRALVATALAEARRGTPVPAAPDRQIAAALTAAARHGLAGPGVDPLTGQAAGAPALRARLLDHVYPALADRGDTETITRLLRRLEDRGTGADRQRALLTSGISTPAFITALAAATLSGHEPAASGPAPEPRQRPGVPLAAAPRESIPAAAPPSAPPRHPVFALADVLASFTAGAAAFWSACADAGFVTGSFFADAIAAADAIAPSSAVRSAAAVIWCTRPGDSAAAAASLRIETPSARAEASAQARSRPAWSRRQAAGIPAAAPAVPAARRPSDP
jgi:carboxylate-amine ligase